MIIWNPSFRLKRLGKYSVDYFPSTLFNRIWTIFCLFHGSFNIFANEAYWNRIGPGDSDKKIASQNVILGYLDYVPPFTIIRIINFLYFGLVNYIDRKAPKNMITATLFFIALITSMIPMIALNLVKPIIAAVFTLFCLPRIIHKHYSTRRAIDELKQQAMKVKVCEITSRMPYKCKKVPSYDPIPSSELITLEALVSEWKGSFYGVRLVPPDKKIEEDIPENEIILQDSHFGRHALFLKHGKVKQIPLDVEPQYFSIPNEFLIQYDPALTTPINDYVRRVIFRCHYASKNDYINRMRLRITRSPLPYLDLLLYSHLRNWDDRSNRNIGLIEVSEGNALAIQAMLKTNQYFISDTLSKKDLENIENSFKNASRSKSAQRDQRKAFCLGLSFFNNNNSPLKTFKNSSMFDAKLVGLLFEYSGLRKPSSETVEEEKPLSEAKQVPEDKTTPKPAII